MSAQEVIAEVVRDEGWTCEYHEPVRGPGECSQCDDSHECLADKAIEALNAAGYAVVKLPEPDEIRAATEDENGYHDWVSETGGVAVFDGGEIHWDGQISSAEELRVEAARLLAAAKYAEGLG